MRVRGATSAVLRWFSVLLVVCLGACGEVSDSGADAAVSCLTNDDCDDGLFCNGAETCGPDGECVQGQAPVIDDGVGCTVDACNEATAEVTHIADDSRCDDGLYCNGAEVCDLVSDCGAGTPVACADETICTTDSCDEDLDMCVNEAGATSDVAYAISGAGHSGSGVVTLQCDGTAQVSSELFVGGCGNFIPKCRIDAIGRLEARIESANNCPPAFGALQDVDCSTAVHSTGLTLECCFAP